MFSTRALAASEPTPREAFLEGSRSSFRASRVCWALGALACLVLAPSVAPRLDRIFISFMSPGPIAGGDYPLGQRDVVVDVDWADFLAGHDLMWAWEWSAADGYLLQLASADLQSCGATGGGCCLSALPSGTAVGLAFCVASASVQRWRLAPAFGAGVGGGVGGARLLSAATGACLVDSGGGAVGLGACSSAGSVWSYRSGLFLRADGNASAEGQCLSIDSGRPFCDGTICPKSLAHTFHDGMPLVSRTYQNGDRSQLFSVRAVSSGGTDVQENLVPYVWSSSAYVGNGLLGVRVHSEEGDSTVLRLVIDNIRLGAGKMRKPTGYFRLLTRAPGTQLHVAMRQHLYNASLHGTVADSSTGQVLLSFSIFVCADLSLPVVVIRADEEHQQLQQQDALHQLPQLEWVSTGSSEFAWVNETFANSVLVYAVVGDDCDGPGCVGDPHIVVRRAAGVGQDALWSRHAQWWAEYWPQSFVSVPVTRVEGFYYTQMYRFPSSDRVLLHGLMGAFGPTENFNLWRDYVWDMNEQVMYWIAPASNRPELSRPMQRFIEQGDGVAAGGLWMVHDYVKQARFEGRDDLLQDEAWRRIVDLVVDEAGMREEQPGKLTSINGTYHYGVNTCNSPEYVCFPPFEHLACDTKMDCNFGLAQLRWGLSTALTLTDQFDLSANLTACGVDIEWWRDLISQKLVWYPHDESGFRLDANCEFRCPHRHFSHLLQIYDLETVDYYDETPSGKPLLKSLMHDSLDTWYRITCNRSNWFNEECRGFTQCGLASMNAVSGRADAAAGNLTSLIDSVITPNGMYGELVYFTHPNMFAPVAESAYCGAASLHTMLLHTSPQTGVLRIFGGLPQSWRDVSFHQLRVDGGALLSAARREGRTRFIRFSHSKGASLRFIVVEDGAWQHELVGEPAGALNMVGDRIWEVNLRRGCHVLVYPKSHRPSDLTISPVARNVTEQHWFGYRWEMGPML
mmetsp:Transcript_164734/g.528496  ORF Transcript_164734/g.528496 Transcript_164734/m.528496 type:complete len:965 (-) Transcript_164734:486-3380(-)